MSDHVEQEAAVWALRHPLSLAERHALDAWLALNPRHAGALLRAQAALSCVDRALAPTLIEFVAGTSRFGEHLGRRRMLTGLGGVAAAVLAGVFAWPKFWGEQVTTTRGEIRRLPLADGSVATIDSDSALRVSLAGQSRRIALSRGQAWFQVAKDRRRPFIVDAGIAQARAVGTAFSVSRASNGVEIAVTEGTVAAWPTGASGTMTILKEGQYAVFTPDGVMSRTGSAPEAIARSLAWRDGEISLEGETLGDAIAQFNRYNRQQLVLADETLSNIRLVGLFQIDKPADFAKTLQATLEIEATIVPGEIRLQRKKSATPDGRP